jgi:hypothetical protein
MAKVNKKDFDKNIDDQIRGYNTLIELQKMELQGLTHIFSLESQRTKAILDIQQAENERNIRYQEYIKLMEQARQGQVQFSKVTLSAIEKQIKREQDHIVKLKAKEKILRTIANIKFPSFEELANIKLPFDDKAIRETILELGLGAEKSQQIRDAFYDAAPKVAQMGASMKDLYSLQQGYTAESGRAVALTGKQLEYITEIGKGTAIGISNAAKLAAQFELLGISTEKTRDVIQGIVDSSERMGVNVNKVLKVVSGNFKQLNTFGFKDGVKGMAQMAQYAEKFKINFNSSINSAEQARTLDGAIEMAAQLQTLGGEFTKADPFEFFHLSRNDPAQFTKRLNEMTKGMASLVKTASGFEMKISPLDLDRLRGVAVATGQDFQNLVEQSQRMSEIQLMNKQMMGTAFSKQDRELIQSMAKLDSKAGIYKVLGKNISDLSMKEVEALKIQQTTLRERAEASQTFDEKFQNTINSMKLTLLPLLDGVNAVFDTIHPYLKGISDWMAGMPKWAKSGLVFAGGLLAGGMLLGKVVTGFKSIPYLGKLFAAGGGKKIASAVGAGTTSVGGGGKSSMGSGLGVGLASAGIGAGIAIAAQGISKLADSMSKLNKDQVDALETIAVTLAVSFPLAAIGVGILAAVAAPAAIPLLALGGAILAIGAGIGVATAGIGYMAEGFSKLITAASPEKVFGLAAGVTALGASMATLAGGSLLALVSGTGPLAMLAMLSTRADQFERIGNAMKNIAVVLNSDGENLRRLKETLDSISNIKSDTGLIAELKSLFKEGIKVKFDEKNVAMNLNVSVEIDSEVIAKKIAKKIVVLQTDYQNGKAG